MAGRKKASAIASSGFFAGRYLVEIVTWDWDFFLGVTPPPEVGTPQLIDARAITMKGRILAPASHRDQRIRLLITPLRSDHVLRDDPYRIGELRPGEDPEEANLDGMACIPEDTLGPVLTSLGSNWKYLHLWASGDPNTPRPITALSFSRTIPPNVRGWAGMG